jgi:hypothetical protein
MAAGIDRRRERGTTAQPDPCAPPDPTDIAAERDSTPAPRR